MTPRPVASIALTLLVIGIAGYGLFEARKIIEGPVISINIPLDGSATSTQAVSIAGTAENISFLSINDNPSFTDKEGHFKELLSLPYGLSILTVSATDRFGRRTSKSVSLNVLAYCTVPKSV